MEKSKGKLQREFVEMGHFIRVWETLLRIEQKLRCRLRGKVWNQAIAQDVKVETPQEKFVRLQYSDTGTWPHTVYGWQRIRFESFKTENME